MRAEAWRFFENAVRNLERIQIVPLLDGERYRLFQPPTWTARKVIVFIFPPF
jgi:hypothetical protein